MTGTKEMFRITARRYKIFTSILLFPQHPGAMYRLKPRISFVLSDKIARQKTRFCRNIAGVATLRTTGTFYRKEIFNDKML
jgi:hypothetical protein